MNKICYGCGIKLQCEDDTALGYVPLIKLENSKYCQRCFRLLHYGENKKNSLPKDNQAIINNINKNADLVLFIMDFIDIFDETIKLYKKIKTKKILVISKSDIIPKNLSISQIERYLKEIYKIEDKIIFISKNKGFSSIIKYFETADNIYFCGITNAGKSTLINNILKKMACQKVKLTTSYKENTTQDFVRVPINDKILIDTPGFGILNYEVDKLTLINREIKPITYLNKQETTYKIGNEFSLQFNNNTSLVFYFSNNVKIARFFKKKVPGVSLEIKENSDIVICGLGFIKTTEKTIVIIPENIFKYINIRSSITGGKYE